MNLLTPAHLVIIALLLIIGVLLRNAFRDGRPINREQFPIHIRGVSIGLVIGLLVLGYRLWQNSSSSNWYSNSSQAPTLTACFPLSVSFLLS